ncbi:MAG: Hint domain-containing protein [Methylococcaceae bacterium]
MSKDPNRELAEQRLNMGKDPGGAYADLNQKYQNQQNNGGGGGGGSCFTGDTKVLTPTGWKRIQEFERNDAILSYSLDENAIIEREVLRIKRHRNLSQVWELKFSLSKEIVKTTIAHSFLTQRGWIKTENLIVGDSVVYSDSDNSIVNQEIVSATATQEYSETYNLVTSGDNNFIVNGAVAHNFTYFRRLRSLYINIGNGFARSFSPSSSSTSKQAT